MWIGNIVADRFRIERPIGSGGMGSVFLATDAVEGRAVAVKVLDLCTEDALERFRREVHVLSTLSHPGIVRYVAHGETSARESFLVMELLQGEDLAQRLTRAGLSVEESLIVVRRAAEALAFAHDQGIVHRDVKPSNLFLVGGDVERVKVLDFGVARAPLQTGALTRTGAMLGTVGYMAPEQAMGSRDLDTRADVFALGCVLFECLTGKPVFSGHHAIAVLAKLLSDEAPRLLESRADLSGALDDLCTRMLAKNRADRPSHLSEVVSVLGGIHPFATGSAHPRSPAPPAALTDSERRIVSVILAEPSEDVALAKTTTPEQHGEKLRRVRKLAERTGVELLPLDGGALVFVVSGRGTASDQAVEAATCALALRRLAPDLRVALATGRAETGTRLPVGPAIDRAAELLRGAGDETARADPEGILVDDVTAALLGARFEVRQTGERNLLVGELADFESPRLLMGKPTPTVGRDKELAMLEATLVECIDDSVARAVLVTAPPGLGKSRVATEFLRKVSARGDTRVLMARADATGAGSALAVAQRLVLQALGVRADASDATKRSRLTEYVRERMPADRAEVVAEFLGEIASIAAEGPPSPFLRAARNDAAVMQEQKRRAFEAFMDAEIARGPLLIVLEDLHWGDAPTVRYLDEALRRLTERALMVLALARPEVHERFPKLWEAAGLEEIRLRGLSRRAAERLVRAVLGQTADATLVAQVIERADGNAFYLEELIRRVAEGDVSFPETVLAMAQSRLERLEPEARRVLRAASVYGETFWSGAVATLLDTRLDAEGWLDALASRELVVRSRESRFAGEEEYVFRHALLRDAAYAMLTLEDCRNAHGRAGTWLEGVGEKDGRVLADHFERAGDAARAVPCIGRAVEAALGSGDFAGTIDLARRGKNLGAAGEALGRLLALEGLALVSRSQPCLPILREAIRLVPAGSTMWWTALGAAIFEAATVGGPEQTAEFVQLALATPPGDELTGPYGLAIIGVVAGLIFIGQAEMASAVLTPFAGIKANDPRGDPVFFAWLDAARSIEASYGVRDGHWRIELAIRLAEKSAQAMAAYGNMSGESLGLMFEITALVVTGLPSRAEAAAQRAILLAKQTGYELMRRWAQLWLAFVWIRTSCLDEAVAVLESLDSTLDPVQEQVRQTLLADTHLRQGSPGTALSWARAACASASGPQTAWAASVLARAHLDLAQHEECLRVAETSWPPTYPVYTGDLLTSKALALRALGRDEEARAALANARDVVLGVSRDIEDPEMRHAFLTNVDECVRTLGLAREWFGEAG